MRSKLLLMLLMSIVALTASIMASAVGSQAPKSGQLAPAKLVLLPRCLANNEVSTALRNLSLGETYEDQQKALALLRANANRSATCRKQVITTLLSAMDQPTIDLTGGQPQFYLWHYGTRLLGELKAVEALDLLIANFDRNDGTPFPMDHHPALVGVIDMGEIALPKLEAALRQNPERYTRRYAVFCIALIGGPSAHQILRHALEGEPDRCVISCIRASLTAFDNKRRPNYITSESRTKWYSTFLCNGE